MSDTTQVYINTKGKDANSYDVIVIGSGISGGWAAKELCDQGLRTLVLERGRNVEHIKDYPTYHLDPWQLPHRGHMTKEALQANPLISKAAGYANGACMTSTGNQSPSILYMAFTARAAQFAAQEMKKQNL